MPLTLSLDSQGSPEGLVRLWAEVEEVLGRAEDPLEILIAREEEEPQGSFELNDIEKENENVWIQRR